MFKLGINFLFFVLFFLNNFYSYSQIEIRQYYDNDSTQIKERYFIKDSLNPILIGEYLGFYISGALKVRGYYKNNVPDSTWTYYYENGNQKIKGQITNGTNNGLWTYFFESGKVNMQGYLVKNVREGKWNFYYESGDLKAHGSYVNNIQNGLWEYFYEDGKLKASVTYNNDSGWYKEFYPSGEIKAEGLNVNGKSEGKWTYYYQSGAKQAIGEYDDGVKTGEWQYFHENGIPSSKGSYVDGKKDGKWIQYHENGQIYSEGALRNGKKEGYWKLYNESGLFKAESVFENDNGSYLEYYESGKLKVEGHIKDGKNDGLWKYYYEDGNLEGLCEYKEGEGEYIGYYPDKTIKMKGKIKDGENVGTWELYHPDGNLAGYYKPVYEQDKPKYLLMDIKKENRTASITPDYKFKNKKIRYFDPVINEQRSYILSTNLMAPLYNRMSLNFEYYIKNRLGYELCFNFLRNPYVKRHTNTPPNTIFSRGLEAAIKQKFYHNEGTLGSFYFAHEFQYSNYVHASYVLDSATSQVRKFKIDGRETKVEYAITVGNRWMKLYGEKWMKDQNVTGLSIDGYIGFGIGYRQWQPNFPKEPQFITIFEEINKLKFSASPRIGVTIGYVF